MKQLKAIDRSFSSLRTQLRAAVKELNQEAANLVSRGRYDASVTLIESAKSVSAFAIEIDALRERWASIRSSPRVSQNVERTPLWGYYALVARALVALDGEGTRGQILAWIERTAMDELKPGDLVQASQGRAVWQRAIGRSRRAMVKEGYLEPDSGMKWKLTKLGREMAKRQK